mgnify:CR=1 FL=1
MHVRANKAYLDMFGFDDFEEIEGISILDMIAPEAAGGFKDLLKKLSKGEKPPSKLEVKAQKSDGSPFDAVMEFAEATFEGEPCQQITLRPQRSGVDAAQLDELRSKDLVTGLFNRTHALAELRCHRPPVPGERRPPTVESSPQHVVAPESSSRAPSAGRASTPSGRCSAAKPTCGMPR